MLWPAFNFRFQETDKIKFRTSRSFVSIQFTVHLILWPARPADRSLQGLMNASESQRIPVLSRPNLDCHRHLKKNTRSIKALIIKRFQSNNFIPPLMSIVLRKHGKHYRTRSINKTNIKWTSKINKTWSSHSILYLVWRNVMLSPNSSYGIDDTHFIRKLNENA